MQEIIGKNAIVECPFSSNAPVAYALRNHFGIKTAVDGGSHFYMRAHPPRRPDCLWTYDEYLGRWTYLYWFMRILFMKHPWQVFLNTFDEPPLERILEERIRNFIREEKNEKERN